MRVKTGVLNILLAGLFALCSSVLFAATYTVDPNGTGDYPTIQAAIDVAMEGDHIILHPGRYMGSGNCYISLNKPITLRSIDPDDPEIVARTIIDGMEYLQPQFQAGISMESSFWEETRIDGLTIINCRGEGIHCVFSKPVIRNCIIKNGLGGSGIYCDTCNDLVITGCTIMNNRGRYGVGGITVHDTPGHHSGLISNCLISNNYGFNDDLRGGIECKNATIEFRNCTIGNNLIFDNYNGSLSEIQTGKEIFIENSNVTIRNCIVWDTLTENQSPIVILDFLQVGRTVSISYSDIEYGKNNVMIFPSYDAYSDFISDNIQVDPNLIDPNTLTWGPGNIDVDPLFVRDPDDGGDDWFWIPDGAAYDYDTYYNNDYGDLHVKSQAGRFVWDGFVRADFNLDKQVDLADFATFGQDWRTGFYNGHPLSNPSNLYYDGIIDLKDLVLFFDDYLQPRVFGEWVQDDVTSPCIDAGDPSDMGWQNELWPHGGRINMGAYGGTAQVSMSPNPVGNTADLNHDDVADLADWSLWVDDWLDERTLLDSDFDRNNVVDINDMTIFMNHWL